MCAKRNLFQPPTTQGTLFAACAGCGAELDRLAHFAIRVGLDSLDGEYCKSCTPIMTSVVAKFQAAGKLPIQGVVR